MSTCYFKYVQSYAVLINFKYPCGSGPGPVPVLVSVPVPALMDLKYIHPFRCSTFEIDLKWLYMEGIIWTIFYFLPFFLIQILAYMNYNSLYKQFYLIISSKSINLESLHPNRNYINSSSGFIVLAYSLKSQLDWMKLSHALTKTLILMHVELAR